MDINKFNEDKLRFYVNLCFQQAFDTVKKERRERMYPFDRISSDNEENIEWSFEFILIKSLKGIWQLQPVFKCSNNSVLRRVEYRLKNNLFKNFGIVYGSHEDMRLTLRSDTIDPNFCKVAVRDKEGTIHYLCVIDSETNVWENGRTGKYIPSLVYERLVFTYWGHDNESYESLPENSEKHYLPYDKYSYDWGAFKELWNKTFGEDVCKYEVVCSKGLVRL